MITPKRRASRYSGNRKTQQVQSNKDAETLLEGSLEEAHDSQANVALVSALKTSPAEIHGRGKHSRVSFKEDLEQQHDDALTRKTIISEKKEENTSSDDQRNEVHEESGVGVGEGIGSGQGLIPYSTITNVKETHQSLSKIEVHSPSSDELNLVKEYDDGNSKAGIDSFDGRDIAASTTQSPVSSESPYQLLDEPLYDEQTQQSVSYLDKKDKYFDIFNVLFENAPANMRVLDEIVHNQVDNWQQILLSEITGVYLEVAPLAAFRLYRDKEVIQFTPIPQSTVVSAEWADAVYSALQIQTRPANELQHFRDLFFMETASNTHPTDSNPSLVAAEVVEATVSEPNTSSDGHLHDPQISTNEEENTANADGAKSKGSMKTLLRKLKDVTLFRSKKRDKHPSSEPTELLPNEQKPTTLSEVVEEQDEVPAQTEEEQADNFATRGDYSKEGVLAFCQDANSDDDDDDDDDDSHGGKVVVTKPLSPAKDEEVLPMQQQQQRSMFRKYPSAHEDQSTAAVTASFDFNPILLKQSSDSQLKQVESQQERGPVRVPPARVKPLLGKKTVLDTIFARPVVVLIPDDEDETVKGFADDSRPRAEGDEKNAPLFDDSSSQFNASPMSSSRDFLLSPYQPKHDMFDSVEWLGVNMTGDASLRVPVTRVFRKDRKSVSFASKEKKDLDSSSSTNPGRAVNPADPELKPSNTSRTTRTDADADLETKLQLFLRSPGSSFPRDKSGGSSKQQQLLQSLDRKVGKMASSPGGASGDLDRMHRTQPTHAQNGSPTFSNSHRHGNPPASAIDKYQSQRYNFDAPMEAPMASKSEYIFEYDVSDANDEDGDSDIPHPANAPTATASTTTNTTTVVAAPKQTSSSSSSSSSSGKNTVPTSTVYPPLYSESVGYRELKSASSLHSEPSSHDRGNDMELTLEPLLAYLHDHTVACSAVYSPETSSYIKLDYLKKEKNSKIILLRDITSVDIDTNGTGLFRIVYTVSTTSRVSKDGCSPESNDDSYSRLSTNNGNYRRKRKVKGTQELSTSTSTSSAPRVQRSSNNNSSISSNVNQDEVDVEERQLVLTSAIPSQLSQWLEKLRQYRHLDAIS